MFVTLNRRGDIKQVKTGFSWTTFFFGVLVPIFRMDFIVSVLYIFAIFINAKISGLEYRFIKEPGNLDFRVVMFSSSLFVFIRILFCFFYNKIYIFSLLKKGYRPNDSLSKKEIERIKKLWPWSIIRS